MMIPIANNFPKKNTFWTKVASLTLTQLIKVTTAKKSVLNVIGYLYNQQTFKVRSLIIMQRLLLLTYARKTNNFYCYGCRGTLIRERLNHVLSKGQTNNGELYLYRKNAHLNIRAFSLSYLQIRILFTSLSQYLRGFYYYCANPAEGIRRKCSKCNHEIGILSP